MAKARSGKTRALDDALKAMFKDLEAKPVPNSVNSVVDQLRSGEPEQTPRRGRGRG